MATPLNSRGPRPRQGQLSCLKQWQYTAQPGFEPRSSESGDALSSIAAATSRKRRRGHKELDVTRVLPPVPPERVQPQGFQCV